MEGKLNRLPIQQKIMTNSALILVLTLLTLSSCTEKRKTQSLEVTATAYNSIASQTDRNNPTTTAWGDELRPGMKCIAVSRDLIGMGLKHRTRVKIEGLPGKYLVLDKMDRRWTKKIDIYMGDDVEAARNWGKRKVTITWDIESPIPEK